MGITRGGGTVFDGAASLSDMVRDPAELTAVLHSSYPLPAGAWLLTGTSLVPPPPYSAEPGDMVLIEIEGVGRLVNHIVSVPHSGARAQPRLKRDSHVIRGGEMKSISRADPKYALDSGHQAVAKVSLGESFVVETHDCRTGTITRADQVRDLLDTRCVNPATGPIAVEGVKGGDTICVEIEQLQVDSRL